MDINRPYIIKWPSELRDIAHSLKKRPFTRKRSEGFLLDRVGKTEIQARYVQRVEKKRVVFDPLGNKFSVDQVEYRETEFRCTYGPIGLQILTPAIGWKRMFPDLNQVVSENLSIKPAKVDLLEWHRKLCLKTSRFEQPTKLHTAPIEVDYGASASIEFSGVRNVIKASNNFLESFDFEVVGLEYRFKDSSAIKVITSIDGSFRISSSASKAMRKMLETTRMESLI